MKLKIPTKQLFRLYLIGLVTFSATSWGAIDDGFGLAKGSEIQQNTIQKGEGFELRNVSYQDKRGNNQSIDLIFVSSEKGAENAHLQVGLPSKVKEEIKKEFEKSGSQKSGLSFRKKPIKPGPISGPAPIDGETRRLIVIDKDLASAGSNDEAEAILLSRGVPKDELESLSKNTNARRGGWSCWKDNKKKSWNNSFDEEINKTKHWGNNNNLSVDINAVIKGDVTSAVDYKYKKIFFCKVPVWVEVKRVIARADYKLSGGISIHGEASHTVDGHTWKIIEPTLAEGAFFVGYIPIVYNITLPISAGTGDLELTASGNIEVDSTLKISGHYEYGCDTNGCSKISSDIDSENIVNGDAIQHSIMAAAKIEPWAKVAVSGSIYWGFIDADVGAKLSLPVALNIYTGNTCDDGDAIDGNENVSAGFVDIDFRAGIEASLGVVWRAWEWNKYWKIYSYDLYFNDFIQPFSTALSPVIRPRPRGLKVEMPVSIRSCIKSIADTNYQDYTINWGDGMTTPIKDLSGRKIFDHAYNSLGGYEISVAHDNGASTSKWVDLSSIPKPTKPDVLVNEAYYNGTHQWYLDVDIRADEYTAEYEISMGDDVIYSGSNGSIKSYFVIKRRGGGDTLSLKARTKNESGWGPYRNFTVRDGHSRGESDGPGNSADPLSSL